MFRVGMGQSPSIPKNLSEEGHEFLAGCFVHDPKSRATVAQLLDHTFVKVTVISLFVYNWSLCFYFPENLKDITRGIKGIFCITSGTTLEHNISHTQVKFIG